MTRPPKFSSPYPSILIVGVGLIGGSLGLAIKRSFRDVNVVGFDRPGVLKKALTIGAIDHVAHDLPHAVGIADLVVLAAPSEANRDLLGSIAAYISPTTLVTDTGSVKRPILDKAAALFPRGNFIGGHPMTGSERSGIAAAQPLLFENAIYVVCPLAQTPEGRIRRLAEFLRRLGSRVVVMEGQEHDAAVAAVSHVPQLAAVALMRTAGKRHSIARKHQALGAGGFRDMTRIATSPFGFWGDILDLNRVEIRRALRLYRQELDQMDRLLRRTPRRLSTSFEDARRLRAQIPAGMKGFLHTLTDIQVFLEDKPGSLLAVLRSLKSARINLKDIELIKVREGLGGTFRLWFDSAIDARKAVSALKRAGIGPASKGLKQQT